MLLGQATGEWAGVAWQPWGSATWDGLHAFTIEVTAGGKAGAAGLSFGPYKDFLVPLESNRGPRRLQLQVDLVADRWQFRVDGQLMPRAWWDSGVRSARDLISGTLGLKARHLDHVLFQDLTLYNSSPSCELSVIITCNRFLQRLRVTLRNWCYQDLERSTYEVLIVNPQSPDGTHEHLMAVARCYPELRVREVPVDAGIAMNKGAMINEAFRQSRGSWVWLTDADCLFGTHSAASVMAQLGNRRNCLFYGQRRYLTQAQTDALLAGRYDGIADFDALAASEHQRPDENAPWGYTQIVHRSILERLPYREDINHFAHSDSAFIDMCRRKQIKPTPIAGLYCLHLDHPFAWYGTNVFL